MGLGDREASIELSEVRASTLEKGKKKEERKQKVEKDEKEGKDEKDGWTIVGGTGRCEACVREDTVCKINLAAIGKWREEMQDGAEFHKNQPGTNCELCATSRKKRCILPATEEMRRALVEVVKTPVKAGRLAVPLRGSRASTKSRGGSSAPSASSGMKRKMRDLEVELAPVTKKMKTAATPMSQVDFYGALVRIMETSERRMAESSRAVERQEEEFGRALRSIAVAVERQNKILVRIETRLTAENWKGKGRARSEDNMTDEVAEETRDIGEAVEAQTVPIINASTPADSRDEAGEEEDDDEDEE
jgi:hypothetical protein